MTPKPTTDSDQTAPQRPSRMMSRFVITALATAIIVAGLIWTGALSSEHRTARECEENLEYLHVALCHYQDTYRTFPAAYYLNKSGVPQHSWRIRVLPFLEQNTIFDAYRFDQPWNSESNLSIGNLPPPKFPDDPNRETGSNAERLPWHLFCPLDRDDAKRRAMASFAMIVGPRTAFPVGLERLTEFPDGLENTITIAEIYHERIHWLEPRDLHIEEMSFHINDATQPSISSRHDKGPAVLFGDGKVFRISPRTPPDLVQALLTADGGERVDRATLIQQRYLE